MVAVSAGTVLHQGDSIDRVLDGWSATRPDLDVSPVAVIGRVFRLSAELQPRLDAALAHHGVRSGDFAVLATLVRLGEPHVSQGRLGRELGLTPGTVSVRLDRLERMGLIARTRSGDDQRRALVGLTEAGQELFDAAVGDHLANSHELVAALDAPESELLAGLLGKLLASLERRPPPRVPRPARRVRDAEPDPSKQPRR
jgi:DNA-binding MarR family transcriptional regulator